jgi:hypothetical protein
MTPLDSAALVARTPTRLLTPRLVLELLRSEHVAVLRESINASLPALGFVHWGQRAFALDDAESFCSNAAGSGSTDLHALAVQRRPDTAVAEQLRAL